MTELALRTPSLSILFQQLDHTEHTRRNISDDSNKKDERPTQFFNLSQWPDLQGLFYTKSQYWYYMNACMVAKRPPPSSTNAFSANIMNDKFHISATGTPKTALFEKSLKRDLLISAVTLTFPFQRMLMLQPCVAVLAFCVKNRAYNVTITYVYFIYVFTKLSSFSL